MPLNGTIDGLDWTITFDRLLTGGTFTGAAFTLVDGAGVAHQVQAVTAFGTNLSGTALADPAGSGIPNTMTYAPPPFVVKALIAKIPAVPFQNFALAPL